MKVSSAVSSFGVGAASMWPIQLLDQCPAARVPRSNPDTLRSSSSVGQLMYSPSPMTRKSARSSIEPWRRLGNHASGTIRVRPSARCTTSSSSVTLISTARGLVSTAKEVIPSLHDSGVVFANDALHLRELVGSEASGFRQLDRRQPEL